MDAHPRLRPSGARVVAVVAVLIAVALFARWMHNRAESRRADDERRMAQMQSAVNELRDAIRRFRTDNGRHPASLDELVPRYLRTIPVDPVTGSASSWRLTTEETVQPRGDFTSEGEAKAAAVIIDVRSAAPGTDARGRPWSEY